jgi:hypothetical protein
MAYTIGNYPELGAGSGKIDIENVYSWVLGDINFQVTQIPHGPEIKARSNVLRIMIDNFQQGSVISLSSQHSDEFINEKTGRFIL